ncbi:PRC-barrel domain-containing protein [Christiangramia sabulilitoris]|uniref:Photosystem reaction center subunit H n=1 Tax=Christiangramia sabulilitoris TaxID=2583991 RepID=A0A550I6W7_9FLAO|nr:PRC-barrel domain-containing protein [Christiangramia sabulilitoris]TRO66701.1 photosystem reaction center subunit H [Christiangramia sabulilitoris]
MSTGDKYLYYLSELKDYKVNRKDPDIRGWKVKDLDNRIIGKVDDFLVNMESGKVVYIDVEVEKSIINMKHDPYAQSQHTEFSEFINKEGENHIIIPINLIDINTENKHVVTQTINYETFAETKRYKSGTTISKEYEQQVLSSYKSNQDQDPDKHDPEEVERTRSAYTHEDITAEDNALGINQPPTASRSGNLRPEKTLDEDSEWKHE